MANSPNNRCGRMNPSDHQVGDDPNHQSCCYREALPDTDSCAWHATHSETNHKTLDNLIRTSTSPDIRDQNSKYNEILSGAILSNMKIENEISFERVLLNDSDLSGTDLQKGNLNGANLHDANLRNVNLEQAEVNGIMLTETNLRNANIQDASLRNSTVSHTDLTEANLSNADLFGSTISDTNLTNTNLQNANLKKTGVTDCVLRNANLVRSDLTDSLLNLSNFNDADLSNATMTDVEVINVNLSNAELKNTPIDDSEFELVDMTNAVLSHIVIRNSDLEGINMTKADLRGAIIKNSNLNRAILHNSDLRMANINENNDFSKANFRDAELPKDEAALKGLNLTDADLQNQDLRNKELSETNLEKADLTDADLSRADLSESNLERALLNRADLFDAKLAGTQLDGVVLGNVQVNEKMFKNLSPHEELKNGPSLIEHIKRIVYGPMGDDDYRCVYDPESRFCIQNKKRDSDKDKQKRESNFDCVGTENQLNKTENKANNQNVNKNETNNKTENEDKSAVRAGGVYRKFEKLAAENALPLWQQKFFILRQDMQIRQKNGTSYLFAVLQRSLFGFGESFRRVFGWSSAIIVGFSFLYLAGGLIRPVNSGGELGPPIISTRIPGDFSVLWESIYYSTLTFTALGFGDFRPVGTLGQVLTVTETALGALLFALIVFVLGRRAAR